MKRCGFRVATGLAALAALAAASAASLDEARAAAGPDGPATRAALLSDAAAVAPGEPFALAIRLSPAAGWHTYWRNPGEAGAPTKVAWRLPEGFAAGPLQWPIPQRFENGPIVSYGYGGDSTLLAEVTPPKGLPTGRSVTVGATVEWLACREICIPEQAELSLTLATAAKSKPADAATSRAIVEARAALPGAPPGSSVAVAEGGAILLLTDFPPGAARSAKKAVFFPDRFDLIDAGAEQEFGADGDALLVALAPAPEATAKPTALSGVLVVTDAQGVRRGYAIEAPIED